MWPTAVGGGGYSDSLFIGVSTDCGASYQYVYYDGGLSLATAPDNQSEFIPAANEWKTDTVDLSSWAGQSNVQIAFRNKGDWGNVLYLDNVNLGSNLGLTEAPHTENPIVFPNPLRPGGLIEINNIPSSILSLWDGSGKCVWTTKAEHAYKGHLPSHLATGWYLLQVAAEKTIWNFKVIVQ